ncbi:MAG: thrombospondin type 3 repeat-containing protein [Gammaproteobacteria bacterium]|nr:thrombospondin type 3 repeat-containing protein [Gammaproteobacteria bacterium]
MKRLIYTLMILCIIPFTVHAADQDNDGIDDSVDRCPNTAQLKKVDPNFRYAITVNPERLTPGNHAVAVNSDGCEPDNDNDGIKNSADYCPDNSALEISKGVSDNGCPIHTDRDGTPDYRDRCPNTAAGLKTDQYGCPKA